MCIRRYTIVNPENSFRKSTISGHAEILGFGRIVMGQGEAMENGLWMGSPGVKIKQKLGIYFPVKVEFPKRKSVGHTE